MSSNVESVSLERVWTSNSFDLIKKIEKDDATQIVINLYPQDKEGEFINWESFFNKLQNLVQNDSRGAITFFRYLGKEIIQKHNFAKKGFRIRFDSSNHPIYIQIIQDKEANLQFSGDFINKAYDENHNFKGYLDDNKTKTQSKAISFRSPNSLKIYIIPAGPYVTIYNFAEQGKDDEILAYLQKMIEDINKIGFNSMEGFYIHTNGNHGQTVPHFHTHVVFDSSCESTIKTNYIHIPS